MARLALLLVFLVLALVASVRAVSAHRTTVTTVTVDDEEDSRRSRGGMEGCHESMLRAHHLRHCRHYLSHGRQILALRGETEEEQKQEHRLQECCQQLRQVEEPCRCKGIRKIAKEEMQREQLQGEELKEMIQRAQNLPSACQMPPMRCEIDIEEY